jgi:hypothetical protein
VHIAVIDLDSRLASVGCNSISVFIHTEIDEPMSAIIAVVIDSQVARPQVRKRRVCQAVSVAQRRSEQVQVLTGTPASMLLTVDDRFPAAGRVEYTVEQIATTSGPDTRVPPRPPLSHRNMDRGISIISVCSDVVHQFADCSANFLVDNLPHDVNLTIMSYYLTDETAGNAAEILRLSAKHLDMGNHDIAEGLDGVVISLLAKEVGGENNALELVERFSELQNLTQKRLTLTRLILTAGDLGYRNSDNATVEVP